MTASTVLRLTGFALYGCVLGSTALGADSGTPSGSNQSAQEGSAQSKNTAEFKERTLFERMRLRQSLKMEDRKGAAIGATRSEGDTDYTVRAGLSFSMGNAYLPQVLQKAAWSWGFGAQVDKTTSANPTDGRLYHVGANGVLFGLQPVNLDTRVSIQYAEDRINRTDSLGIRLDGVVTLSEPILAYGIPYSRNTSAHYIYPRLGLYLDRITDAPAGGETGNTTGGYVGITASYFPGGLFWPIHISGSHFRIRDFEGIGSAAKRSSNISEIGISYAFFDPRGPTPAVLPELSLVRRVGSNHLDGIAATNETVLLFTLKIN